MVPYLTLPPVDDPNQPDLTYDSPVGAVDFESLDSTGRGRIFLGVYASLEAFEAGKNPIETREYELGQTPAAEGSTPLPTYEQLLSNQQFANALGTVLGILLMAVLHCDAGLAGGSLVKPS